MKFNLRDLQNLTEGKDGKMYAYIGFPKGTIYEGYLVLIPFHLALPAQNYKGDIDFWEYEINLPNSFIYHLSKTEIGLDEKNMPVPTVDRVRLNSTELEENYRKFSDSYIDNTRVNVGNESEIGELLNNMISDILLNRPNDDRDFIDNILHNVNKLDSILYPKKDYSVNMRYIIDLKEALLNVNLKKVNETIGKINSQVNARSSYEMSYKFKDMDVSKLQFIKHSVKDIESAKVRNERHKIEKL